MSNNYCLFFSGEIEDGFELRAVKNNFQAHLGLSDVQLEQYFSGIEVIVSSNLSQIEALSLVSKINDIGGVCYFDIIRDETLLPEGVLSDRRKTDFIYG